MASIAQAAATMLQRVRWRRQTDRAPFGVTARREFTIDWHDFGAASAAARNVAQKARNWRNMIWILASASTCPKAPTGHRNGGNRRARKRDNESDNNTQTNEEKQNEHGSRSLEWLTVERMAMPACDGKNT
jgi:hypothetical protein